MVSLWAGARAGGARVELFRSRGAGARITTFSVAVFDYAAFGELFLNDFSSGVDEV